MNKENYTQYIIRLADDVLILGQRLSEWCGHGPVLEEDIALSNISLDYIGQATLVFKQIASDDALGRDEDAIALTRMESEYNNALLLELPNGDYAKTIARQFYYSTFYLLFLKKLKNSSDSFLAGFAEKSIKEVRYHLQHATDWMLRMGDGTEESHVRAQSAVDQLWPYLGEFFEMDEVERIAVEEGHGVDRSLLVEEFRSQVATLLGHATLVQPNTAWHHTGGRHGRHTEHMGFLLAEMQFLQRAYPGSKW